MSTNNEKKNLKFFDLPSDITKNDIESFLSKYKDQINTITIEPYKETKKIAKVSFKDNKSADDCRINMNLRKIKNSSVRILWDEKDTQFKNYYKNNLHIREIPKNKTSREIFEYFHKFGDISSIKINEDENGIVVGTGYITYYNQDNAKKAMDETNGKKIWDSNMELAYQTSNKNDRNYHHYNYQNYQNYHNNNDNKFKININNIPDNYTNDDIQKLCEEFGKIQNINVLTGQHGKYANVVFSNEVEAKKAVEKLNNKEVNDKKLIVKEYQRKPNFQQNNPNYLHYFNNQYPTPNRYEDPFENNNKLYIRNIPLLATEEDLRKVFEPFGTIKSIKLDMETVDVKEKDEIKKRVSNKGYGYISYENAECAKKARESLNNTHLQGFGSFPRPLIIDFYIPKDKRKLMENMPTSGFNYMEQGMIFPHFQGFPPQMIRVPFPNQYIWQPGNFPNRGYNTGFKQKYNKRGGYRGGYNKNNHQRKNNNMNKQNQNQKNMNNNENENNYQQEKKEVIEENKEKFDYETFNNLNEEEKRDFLGERLFASIQESPQIVGKNIDIDTIGKITGMIIAIPKEEEIIEILENPSVLDSRILEGLTLLQQNK